MALNFLDDNFVRRLIRMLKWFESFVGTTFAMPPEVAAGKQPAERVFELQANLDAGGTATAYLAAWNGASGSGEGDYAADNAVEFTLTDTTGQFWGIQGELIRARPLSSDNGVVWEVVSSGSPYHVGTCAAGSAGITSGGSGDVTATIKGVSRTVTAYDEYLGSGDEIADGDTVGIEYDVEGSRWVIVNAVC